MGAIPAIRAKQEEDLAEYDQSRLRAAEALAACLPEYVDNPKLAGLEPLDVDEEEFPVPDLDDIEAQVQAEVNVDDDGEVKVDPMPRHIREVIRAENVAFITACAEGWHLKVSTSLASRLVSVSFRDIYGRTPLYMAAERGQHVILESLIKAKGNVEDTTVDGWTPLHTAAFNGNVRCMELLIKQGASVNQREKYGITPLAMATSSPKLFLVDLVSIKDRKKRLVARKRVHKMQTELTLEKKGDPDELNPEVNALTMYQYYPNHIEVIVMGKLLNRFGIEVDSMDKRNRTPLTYAARYGRLCALSYLLAMRADAGNADRDGRTPLFHAAGNGHLGAVSMLLQVGGQVNRTDAYFATPLHAALGNDDEQITLFLLKANASVNAYDCEGRTPVMLAMDSANRRIFTELVRCGSNLDVLDRQGWNVVIYAIERGMFSEVLNVLQRAGDKSKAILRYGDTQGRNCLHHAVALASAESAMRVVTPIMVLDPELAAQQDCNGNTPVHMAAELGRLEAMHIMTSALPSAEMENNRKETPLHLAAHCGFMDCVIALLHDTGEGAMCNASSRDIDGRTLLMHACISGHLDLVNLLLKNRDGQHKELAIPEFNINAVDSFGTNALIVAAREGHWHLLPSLVLAGASITQKDNDGYTALHWAATSDEALVVICLIDLGFDMNSRDGNGWTPLMHAADRGCNNTARLFVDNGADLDARNLDGDTVLQICMRRIDKDAGTMVDILTDGVLDRDGNLTGAVPAQGHFMCSVLAGDHLHLEGLSSEPNVYVCLEFKANRLATSQLAYTSCCMKNADPEWHEVFRFDTQYIDPSAYLVAWLMAAPGEDETDVIHATNLGITEKELQQLKMKGVDLRRFKKPEHSSALDMSLKMLRRRADASSDSEDRRLKALVGAQVQGSMPTEDLKRSKDEETTSTLESRRWLEVKNFLSVLKRSGCDAQQPLAPRSHVPIGVVVTRFRQLRTAVWGTVPVEIDRGLRLSPRGSLSLEVDFRPNFFAPVDPSGALPAADEEENFPDWDQVGLEHLQAAFPKTGSKRPLTAGISLDVNKEADFVKTETEAVFKRFTQLAYLSANHVRKLKKAAALKAQRTYKAEDTRKQGQKMLQQIAAKVKEKRKQMRDLKAYHSSMLDIQFALPPTIQTFQEKKVDQDVASIKGLLDHTWVEELVESSRLI